MICSLSNTSYWDTPAAMRDYLTLAGVVRTSEAAMLKDSSNFYLIWGVWSHFFILLQYTSYVLNRKKLNEYHLVIPLTYPCFKLQKLESTTWLLQALYYSEPQRLAGIHLLIIDFQIKI